MRFILKHYVPWLVALVALALAFSYHGTAYAWVWAAVLVALVVPGIAALKIQEAAEDQPGFAPVFVHVRPSLALLLKYGLIDEQNSFQFIVAAPGSPYAALHQGLRFTLLLARNDFSGIVYWNGSGHFTSEITGWTSLMAAPRGDAPLLSGLVKRTIKFHLGGLPEEPQLSEAATRVRRSLEENGLRLYVQQEPDGLRLGMERRWVKDTMALEWEELPFPGKTLAVLPWCGLGEPWQHLGTKAKSEARNAALTKHGWTEEKQEAGEGFHLEHKYFEVWWHFV